LTAVGRWTLLLLLLCPLFVARPAAANEIDTLLDKVAASYGVAALPGGLKAVRQTGRTFSAMRGEEGSILRAFQQPDRLRVEIRYAAVEEVRVLSGSRAWKQGEPMSGSFQAAMLLQAARMALPWNLQAERAQLRDLGASRLADGTALREVELPLGIGLVLRVAIDSASGRILRSVGRLTGSMGVMEFATIYEDFRVQDGILYAATERHFAMEQATGHTRIEHIEFLDSLPDELFVPTEPARPRTRT
jgi:hypothetical protein